MTNESRAQFNKPSIFGVCEQMGESAVLSDLERAGVKFSTAEQKWLAWEWVYTQRLKRDEATGEALRTTAKQTFLVAVFTALVALFTAALVVVEVWRSHP